MSEWRIGDLKVIKVLESEDMWKGHVIAKDMHAENILREADWLLPRFANEEGRIRISFHSLVVESGGLRILIDTCIGNDKPREFARWNVQHWPFLSDLEKAGYPRESIDRVICTHLHVDHVGWNTMLQNGRWVPTFPNARYLIGRKEWAHWGAAGEDGGIIGDSVRPVFDAGLVDLVEPDHRLTDEIWLEPTHGHTPGHVSVRISSRGEEAVISGDLMHHPIQLGHPDWKCTFDTDWQQGCKTRRAFMERYADGPVLVLGTHFATPSAGHIVKHEGAFRFRI